MASFADEIDRLFEQLVRAPWARRQAAPSATPGDDSLLELEMPIAGGPCDDLSIALRDRALVVQARRARPAGSGERGEEVLERRFVLPPTAELRSLEARIDDATLHIRLRIRVAE
jgi:HSP20 family molecular chaperone IbpA